MKVRKRAYLIDHLHLTTLVEPLSRIRGAHPILSDLKIKIGYIIVLLVVFKISNFCDSINNKTLRFF